MADFKDKAVSDFITALEKMRKRTVDLILRLKDKFTEEELRIVILTQMRDIVLNEMKFQGNIDRLMTVYDSALRNMISFAVVDEDTLLGLKEIEKSNLNAEIALLVVAMQREFVSSSITGNWNKNSIVENLKSGINGNLTDKKFMSSIDNSVSVYKRNVTAEMMNKAPKDTKYIYAGPLDEKTRPICIEMITAGALTHDEIISQFGASVLSVGGGYNCRHEWVKV